MNTYKLLPLKCPYCEKDLPIWNPSKKDAGQEQEMQGKVYSCNTCGGSVLIGVVQEKQDYISEVITEPNYQEKNIDSEVNAEEHKGSAYRDISVRSDKVISKENALICEMCNSHDIVKKDGLYICQNCGTKYSIDEAKKMFNNGNIEVSVNRTNEIENRVDNAINEYKTGNYDVAFNMLSEVLNIDPKNYRAIMYKGLASGWSTSMHKFTINVTEKEILRGIKYLREDAKDDLDYSIRSMVILTEVLQIGVAVKQLIHNYEHKQGELVDDIIATGKKQQSMGSDFLSNMYTPEVARAYLDGARDTYNRAMKMANSYAQKTSESYMTLFNFMHNILEAFVNAIENPEDVAEAFYEVCHIYMDCYTALIKNGLIVVNTTGIPKKLEEGKYLSIAKTLGITNSD